MLEHEVVPFLSYPYEWSFSMLRDAALLQLELVHRALDHGMILKDSSPYNVQWRGACPVFIDLGSFEPLREGEPWAAYRQFCMLFLYPLLLQAYKGVPFQPWLRGRLDGILPEECRRLMSRTDLLRPGVGVHVALQSRLERRYAETDRDVKGELRAAGFRKELIAANVRRLERIVRGLSWRQPRSAWTDYGTTAASAAFDRERKTALVADTLAAVRPRLVWDLGCNDGHYARAAAEAGAYVLAIDADAVGVDRFYSELCAEGSGSVLPLVVDLADPSPALGWRGLERQTLEARGTPDLVLCLAVVHHVVIGGNVPVAQLVDWLWGLRAELVIEFPEREDPMVQRLLARKRSTDHPDYHREPFERCLSERFDVVSTTPLPSGTRVLYRARPKGCEP